jgi:hypothetical protein
MKSIKYFLVVLVFLAIAALACGSTDGVQVNTPDNTSGEIAADIPAEAPIQEDVQTEPEPTQPKPTATKPIGTARSNPAPVGSEIVADNMAFMILSAVRPADDIIKRGNPFNTEPESGEEYILIELQAVCQKSSDEKCSLSPFFNFSLIGSLGIEYDPEIMTAGVDGLLDSIDFFGETTVSGYLPFIIGQDETELILVYEPFLFGDTFYLAVPEN